MWLSARSGRITAFNFHDVKTKKDSTKSDCLVSKFLCKSSGSVDKSALIWGRKQEPIAKKFDKPFWDALLQKLKDFYKNEVMPRKPVYVPISFSKPQTKVEIFSCPFCRTSTIPSSLVRRSALHTDSFKASEPLNGMMPYGLAKTYSLLMLLIFIHSGMIDTTPEKTTPMQHKLLPYNTYIYWETMVYKTILQQICNSGYQHYQTTYDQAGTPDPQNVLVTRFLLDECKKPSAQTITVSTLCVRTFTPPMSFKSLTTCS
ncbi:hypothetical protein KUTeg_014854, partial [Tegillarca granosa]